MGYSWVVAGTIALPAEHLAGYRAAKVDPSAFEDWPDVLDDAGRDALTTDAILNALAGEEMTHVNWDGATLSVRAILSNGGWFWAGRRSHLAAAFRAAAAFGGEGELAIVGALDNASGVALRVAVAEGKSRVEVLRGKARAALEKKLKKIEDAVVSDESDRRADERWRAPLVTDAKLAPIHESIIARLRAQAPARIIEAAKSLKGEVSLRPAKGLPKRATLAKLYPNAPSLLDALARGDARVQPYQAAFLVTASLRLLAKVAPDEAREMAEAIRATKTTHPIAEEALALAAKKEAGSDLAATLSLLRREMPAAAVYKQHALATHPLVKQIAARRSASARATILKEMARTLGGPAAGQSEWKELGEKDASFAFVLVHLLASQKNPADLALLRVLYGSHPHWMIASSIKAARLG